MCKTDECEEKSVVRGWCRRCYSRNYMRAKRNGDNFERKHRWGKRKYDGQHAYMKAHFGAARNFKCDACGEQAHEWAFIKKWCPSDELLTEKRQNGEIEYSLNPKYYIPMCRRHHRALDNYLKYWIEIKDYA